MLNAQLKKEGRCKGERMLHVQFKTNFMRQFFELYGGNEGKWPNEVDMENCQAYACILVGKTHLLTH
jgi:hypothetical protein